MDIVKTDFVCQRCGACCELFGKMAAEHLFNASGDVCPNYDTGKKLCIDFENRPDECRTKRILGDQYQIDTCRLLRSLRKWGKRLEDKERLYRTVTTLLTTYFGGTAEEVAKVKKG